MSFRFLHTADLHLDSPLKSLALRDERLSVLIGNASRTALTRIVDLCLDEQVDALLIAGDLYDGVQTSMKTARFLAVELLRLDRAGVRCFIIRGNHDAQSKITRELQLPPCVTVFDGRGSVERMTVRGQDVAIHGISFQKPHAPESLLARFKPPVPGALNIGMLHTSLIGDSQHDPYAPCSVAELRETGFDYWALGHIHKRAVHEGHIVMPGIPQGRDIGEAGAKSVTLAQFKDGALHLEERAVAVAQFERALVPLAGVEDWLDLIAAMQAAINGARQAAEAEHLVLRLTLAGDTPLGWRMRRDLDQVLAEAQVLAETLGGVWIDKIELGQAAPLAAAGAVGELQALVDLTSPGLLAEADQLMEKLQRALPPALRAAFGQTPEEAAAQRDALLAEGVAEVLAHLLTDPQVP